MSLGGGAISRYSSATDSAGGGRRWVEGGLVANTAAVLSEDVICVATKHTIKLLIQQSNKTKLYHPGGGSDGVGVMTGREDLEVLAWSERCMNPRVFVYQYSQQMVKIMDGDAAMEYKALAFSCGKLLAGLTGRPDYKVQLWNWDQEILLTSVSSGISGLLMKDVLKVEISFPPSSSHGITSQKTFQTQMAGVLSVWNIEKIRNIFQITPQNVPVNSVLSSCWVFPAELFLITASMSLYKYDPLSKDCKEVVTGLQLIEELHTIKNVTTTNTFVRSHFDGLILVLPCRIVLMSLEDDRDRADLVASIDTGKTFLSLLDHQINFSYTGWCTDGGLFSISTSETEASVEAVLNEEASSTYVDACFLPVMMNPEMLITLDTEATVRIVKAKSKKVVMKMRLPITLLCLCCIPNLPLVLVGTSDGRVLTLFTDISLAGLEEEEGEGEAASATGKARRSLPPAAAISVIGEVLVHNLAVDSILVQHKSKLGAVVNKNEVLITLIDVEKPEAITTLDEVTVEGALLDFHIQGNLGAALSTQDTKPTGFGDIITTFRWDESTQSINGVSIVKLSFPCSGLVLSDDLTHFYTLLQHNKSLTKLRMVADEERAKVYPASSLETKHQLHLNNIDFTPRGDIALAGADGRLSIQKADMTGQENIYDLHHFQAGGICRFNISEYGSIIAVSGDGSLSFLDLSEANLSMERTSAEVKIKDVYRACPEIEVRASHPGPSCREEKAAERREKERNKFSHEIREIESRVSGMAGQVAEIIVHNQQLPERYRLDRAEFELDVDEQNRRVDEGRDKLDDLRTELKAWNMARSECAVKVKREVWHSMEAKGRALCGVRTTRIVRNFPLTRLSTEDETRLENAIKERELEVMVTKELRSTGVLATSIASNKASNLARPISPAGSSRPLSSQQTPRSNRSKSRPGSSVKMEQEKNVVKEEKGDLRSEDGLESQSSVNLKYELLGSNSYKYIDIESTYLTNQLEITTQKQSHQQMILLKNVIRRLKQHFNKEFEQLFKEKESLLESTASLNSRLRAVLTELRLDDVVEDLTWTAEEQPEQYLPEGPLTGGDERPDGGGSSRDSLTGKDLMKKKQLLSSIDVDEGSSTTIPPPTFIKNKSAEFWTDEEVAAAESHLAEVLRLADKSHFRRRELEGEKGRLQTSIDQQIKLFDAKLEQLFWLRIDIEKCVLCEELKILNISRDLTRRDKLLRDEESLRKKMKMMEVDFAASLANLNKGISLLEHMEKEHSDLMEEEKTMDKNFKREFPGLGFHQLDSLYKLFKKRPKVTEKVDKTTDVWGTVGDSRRTSRASNQSSGSRQTGKHLKSKTVQAALARMSNMFMGTITVKGPKTSTAIGLSLDDMDRIANCPENVDKASWNLMCKLRREKIELEESIKLLAKDLTDAALVIEQRKESHRQLEAKRADLMATLESFQLEKRNFAEKVEVQVMLKRGQVEVEMDSIQPHTKNCILVTDSVVERLNYEILSMGESKLTAMEESKEYRSGSMYLRWEFDRLLMQKFDLEEKWREIQQTKLSKENQKILGETVQQASRSQEFAILDKTNRQLESFHQKRMSELEGTLQSVEAMCDAKSKENYELAAEITELEETVKQQEAELLNIAREEEEERSKLRLMRLMKKNRLAEQIREQRQLLDMLQMQMENYVTKTFPTLG